MSATRWWIYVLRQPVTGDVRYVGKSKNPRTRLRHHLKPKVLREKSHRARWLRQLVLTGTRPALEVIDTGMGNGAGPAERAWIREYRARGADLVNSTDGGEGVRGYERSAESREKNRIAQLGRKASASTRAKQSAAHLGRKRSPEAAAKMATILGERNRSEKQRAATGAFHRARPKSAEQRAKISATLTGRTMPDDVRARIATAQTGRTHSAESIERMRVAAKKRWVDMPTEKREQLRQMKLGRKNTAEANEKNRTAALARQEKKRALTREEG